MDTNDILQDIHNELIAKLKAKCKVDGNAKAAILVGRDLAYYGNKLMGSFADDGTISDAEESEICATFSAKVLVHIPAASGGGVKIAWQGFTIFGIGWVGLKAKLGEWFGLFKD